MKTIAEKRQIAASEMAKRKDSEPTAEQISKAKKILNSFYRFWALEDRLLMLENDERTANEEFVKRDRERANRWHDRLNKELKEYNLKLSCAWCHYDIYEPCKNGGIKEVFLTHFYN